MQTIHFLLSTLREPRSAHIALKFGACKRRAYEAKAHHDITNTAHSISATSDIIIRGSIAEDAMVNWENLFLNWKTKQPKRSAAIIRWESKFWNELSYKAIEMGLVNPQQLTPQFMEYFLCDLEFRALSRQSIRARISTFNRIFHSLD